jgi:hypothetical protein
MQIDRFSSFQSAPEASSSPFSLLLDTMKMPVRPEAECNNKIEKKRKKNDPGHGTSRESVTN